MQQKNESLNDIWIPYISSIGSWSQLQGSIKFRSWDKDWVQSVIAKEIVLNVDKDLSVVVHCNLIYNKEQLEAMSNNRVVLKKRIISLCWNMLQALNQHLQKSERLLP